MYQWKGLKGYLRGKMEHMDRIRDMGMLSDEDKARYAAFAEVVAAMREEEGVGVDSDAVRS